MNLPSRNGSAVSSARSWRSARSLASVRSKRRRSNVLRCSAVVASGAYPEGLLWHGGKLYFTEMGADRVTVRNMKVLRVDAENNLLLVRGAVPGPNGGLVLVRNAVKAPAEKKS